MGPLPRRDLRLHRHRVPDAHGHADHRGGFLPVGFARSGAGEYVFSLFQVVGISLVLSWVVAVLFTPCIGFKLLREHPGAGGHADEEAIYQRGFNLRFRRLVELCLVRRQWVIGVTLLLFAGSLALFGVVPKQFFPASDRPELMVDPWLPQAATFEASQREVEALEAQLRNDPDVVAVTSYVGNGSPRFYLPLDVQTPDLNLGELMVMTRGGEARERVLAKIQGLFETGFPLVRVSTGRRTGRPSAIRCSSASSGRTIRRCAPSPSRWPRSCVPSRMCAA
jgi:multidrug efflux pump